MQQTSDLYKEIVSGDFDTECRLAVGKKNTAISGLTTIFYGSDLFRIKTSRRTFQEGSHESSASPSVGGCIVGTIDVEMWMRSREIPRQAKLVPQVRVTDGTRFSEWISKGVYYIDTRKEKGTGRKRLILTGYDDLAKAEQDYPASTLDWPAKDIDVVREIAQFIGVEIDPRTVAIMANAYEIQTPISQYSCRETLGNIAALYGGNFVMNDVGQLRLLILNEMPKSTRYLVDNAGAAITFGGVRILV